jgi:HlyD family secretion protein
MWEMIMDLVRRRRLLIIVIAVILFILFLIFRGCGSKIGLVYEYDKITRGEITSTISVIGSLEVLKSYIVTSQIQGNVSRLYVDFNQRVTKNQSLALIDSPGNDQNFMKVKAQMEKADLDLQGAKVELDGKKNLYKDKLISVKEMESAELNYRKILSGVKQIRIDYNIAVKNLSFMKVLSPGSGMIISREIEENTPVGPGKVLFVIAENLQRMKLTINVDETDIGKIKKGMKVYFSVSAYPEKAFEGSIEQVRFNPVRIGEVVAYQSLVMCDNRELLLKPGMTATATVVIGIKKDVIRVPKQAFVVSPIEMKKIPGKRFVWVKDRLAIGKIPLRKVEVKTGLQGDHQDEALSGNLKEGDEVLIGVHKSLESKDELSGYAK